jgi:hypothetical protein
MQIWEEGYLSTRLSYVTMHTRMLLVLDGAALTAPDGSLDRAVILARVRAIVGGLPFFRLRLQRGVLGLTPPAWTPDETFDVARHVSFADGESTLGVDDLWGLTGVDDDPMPIGRPLWRFRFTRLVGGDVALGAVFHHASLDGQGVLKLLSSITDRQLDEPARTTADPFAAVRAARAFELPLLAFRQFRDRTDSPADAWRAFCAKPLARRARRLVARTLRPLLDRVRSSPRRMAERLPERRTAFVDVDSRSVTRRGAELGGTLSDLLIAGLISAVDRPGPVSVRFPVSGRPVDGERARNQVVDIRLHGSAASGMSALVPEIRAQVVARGTDASPAPHAREIGACTLLPWVSTPRYFAGALVKSVVPFSAGLGDDEASGGALLYNGRLAASVTMRADRDVQTVAATLGEVIAGAPAPTSV